MNFKVVEKKISEIPSGSSHHLTKGLSLISKISSRKSNAGSAKNSDRDNIQPMKEPAPKIEEMAEKEGDLDDDGTLV